MTHIILNKNQTQTDKKQIKINVKSLEIIRKRNKNIINMVLRRMKKSKREEIYYKNHFKQDLLLSLCSIKF